MRLHAIQEYIKYRWKAKGRHGTHSPFVYAFVEQVLRGPRPATVQPDIKKHLQGGYASLLQQIADHYGCKKIVALQPEQEEHRADCDMAILNSGDAGNWIRLFNSFKPVGMPQMIVVVCGIHSTARHTKKWNRLVAHPRVKLSMDLYGMGVLFFRDEFKEKQHFVLR